MVDLFDLNRDGRISINEFSKIITGKRVSKDVVDEITGIRLNYRRNKRNSVNTTHELEDNSIVRSTNGRKSSIRTLPPIDAQHRIRAILKEDSSSKKEGDSQSSTKHDKNSPNEASPASNSNKDISNESTWCFCCKKKNKRNKVAVDKSTTMKTAIKEQSSLNGLTKNGEPIPSQYVDTENGKDQPISPSRSMISVHNIK